MRSGDGVLSEREFLFHSKKQATVNDIEAIYKEIARLEKLIHELDPETQPYEGSYTVTPDIKSQILETQNKKMLDDLTVEKIPYYSVSNESGYTVIIGGK